MTALVTDNFGLIAILLIVPAIVFTLVDHPRFGRIFRIVPAIVFAYFIPTALTFFGIIPPDAPVYSAIKKFVLPASLLLLTMSVDIRGIFKLGSKAVIMFLSATFGIVIGGPIALLLWQSQMPDEIWRGMSALAGSWIGGGANFVAMGVAAEVDTIKAYDLMGMMVLVDVLCANIWTGCLMYFAGSYKKIDKKLGADNSSIEELKTKVVEFQKKTNRISSTTDMMVIAALGFGIAWLSIQLGNAIPTIKSPSGDTIISNFVWTVIIVTTIAVIISFTRLKNYEGAGASKIGTVLLYMLIGVIGAGADLHEIAKYPALFLMGLTWILIHVIIMLVVMKLIKAPLFFMAVGSQANVGGAASAPIVASAFHPSLASVGVMLGIGGYVLGTYAALLCMHLMKFIAT